MAKFEPAVKIVLKHEGGYVDDPNDSGGETNFGISKRTYPYLDIRNLTVEEAKEIYFNDFWSKYAYDKIQSQKLSNKLFDISINVGSKRAHEQFQLAINSIHRMNELDFANNIIKVDGWVGEKTAAAANKLNWEVVMYVFQLFMGQFYLSLGNDYYLKGWLRRLFS